MKQYLLPFFTLLLITIHTWAQSPTLWGLAYGGGAQAGTIFSFNTATNLPVTIYSFNAADTDGYRPDGTMMEGTDGYFYGTTNNGGKEMVGTIFRYDVTSGVEKVLHSFTEGNLNDGTEPGASLIQVNNSMLYGVAQSGGDNVHGTIFSYNILTGEENTEYDFAGGTSDAASTWGALYQLSDTVLYGLSEQGGTYGYGTIYKYNMATQVETVVYNFGQDTDGRYSTSSFIKATDGLLYAMTYAGGKNNAGTIFNFNPATGVETVLHSFGGFPNGVSPYSSFIQVGDSNLYATSYEGGNHSVGTIFKYNIYSHKTTQLYVFGSGTDGQYPYYGPLFAVGNLLYGMTQMGGVNGEGIIFTYDISKGTETDVYDFNASIDSCGIQPKGGFIEHNITTGVKQLSVNSNQLSVYPNPTSDFIMVKITSNQTQPVQLSLYNMLGQEVYTTLTPSNTNSNSNLTATIMVTNLPNGVYVLRANEGGTFEQKEIIVAR